MFNTDKFRLGSLCKREHDYEGTGKSLRYKCSNNCIECHAISTKKYREDNKEKIKEYNEEIKELKCKNAKVYYEQNKEKIKNRVNKYREDNKEKIKEYITINKEKIKNHMKEYREQNKEKIQAMNRKYCEEHKEQKKEYQRDNKEKVKEYNKKKYKEDRNHKLLCLLRSRMRHALHGKSKSAHSLELLGCTVEEWKKHIESTFQKGMTWLNYGTYWHIDHIKQCVRFDLSDPVQQKECFNYKNTRALTAVDNLKRDRK